MDWAATATTLTTTVGSTFASIIPVGIAIITAFLGYKIVRRVIG